MPLNMFVNPVVKNAALPELFTKHGVVIEKPENVAPETIAKNREQWVKAWSSLAVK